MLGLAHGLKYSHRPGRDPPRHQGDEHPDRHQRRGQARRLRPGDDRGRRARRPRRSSQRTVDYSALERTCGSPKGDPRSDIFFLGCVFYQMLTGQLADARDRDQGHARQDAQAELRRIKPLSEHRYAPDPELCRIIEKMMKVDLKARYQTMDEVIDDLEAYEKQGSRRRSRGRGRRLRRSTSRRSSSTRCDDDAQADVGRRRRGRNRRPRPATAAAQRGRGCCPRTSSASRARRRSRTPSARPSRRWAIASSSSATPSAPPSATASSPPTP